MEPAFRRGDILFLNNQDNPIRVGEVVVFKIKDRDIPIVHRVMKVHEKPNGDVDLLTKGDNNRVDDRGLYAPGQLWLQRQDVLGRAIGTLRYVGMVTIILNDYPALKRGPARTRPPLSDAAKARRPRQRPLLDVRRSSTRVASLRLLCATSSTRGEENVSRTSRVE